METRLMTYQELSSRLKVSRAAAKRLANKRKWPKALGTDGMCRVAVPLQVLAEGAFGQAREPSQDLSRESATRSASTDVTAQSELDCLRREVRRLKAKLLLVDLEREADRKIADEAAATIRSLALINDQTAAALQRALDTRQLPTGTDDEDTRVWRLLQEKDHWHRLADERLAKLREATKVRPTLAKSFLRWLRAMSPL